MKHIIILLLLMPTLALAQGIWRPSGVATTSGDSATNFLGGISVEGGITTTEPSLLEAPLYIGATGIGFSNPYGTGLSSIGYFSAPGFGSAGGAKINLGNSGSAPGVSGVLSSPYTLRLGLHTGNGQYTWMEGRVTIGDDGNHTELLYVDGAIKVDTVITPLRVIDTTNTVVLDSVVYQITEHRKPITPKYSLYAARKTGTVTLAVYPDGRASYYSTPQYMFFRADSTNGVSIMGITYKTYGQVSQVSGTQLPNGAAFGTVGYNAAGALSLWSDDASNRVLKFTSGFCPTSYYWKLLAWAGNHAITGFMEITIAYDMPSGNSSSTPIYMTSN